jgi:hypothetical protein
MMAGIYIIAQLLGALAAAYALKALFPEALFTAARGGGQVISLDISSAQAFFAELIATFFLVFAVFGTAVDPQAPRVGGFAIGLTLAAAILAIGPLTGASLNPPSPAASTRGRSSSGRHPSLAPCSPRCSTSSSFCATPSSPWNTAPCDQRPEGSGPRGREAASELPWTPVIPSAARDLLSHARGQPRSNVSRSLVV